MNTLSKTLIGVTSVILITLFSLLMYRAIFWTFIDNYEFAYSFNGHTGETKALMNPDTSNSDPYRHGYVRSFPFLNVVHTIDTRPIQICISGGASTGSSSTSTRVLNCKLVQFNPKGYKTFIGWHGRNDYNYNNLEELLKNYAYDGSIQNYPFLTILKELKNEDVQDNIEKSGIPVSASDSSTKGE